MPQTADVAIIVVGTILLLIGILGAPFKGFGFEISQVTDRRIRIFATALGLLLLFVQITRFVDRVWPLTTPNPVATAATATPIATPSPDMSTAIPTSISIASPSPLPTIVPTFTPMLAPTPEPTALPTAIPPTEIPPTAVPTAVAYEDEFNGPELNPSWFWLNEASNQWSLSAVPGKLQIIGTAGDMAETCNNHKNLLLQQAPSGDFEIQTKLTIHPTANYQQGGLIIFNDVDNYVKLDVAWSDASSVRGENRGENVQFIVEKDGKFPRPLDSWPWAKVTQTNTDIFLKISKVGSLFVGAYSFDGQAWTGVGSLNTSSIVDPKMGVYAIGGASIDNPASCVISVPDIPVAFDFFHVKHN
jgi:regulation of enolase protein 1 (concanavalin A-like superfamily)